MTSLKELLIQRQSLELKIAELQKSEVAEAIFKARALVEEYSLTPDQIFPSASGSKTRKASTAKVAAKYRDPITGKEWSGRGLAPKWLAGKNKKDFLIV